MAAFESINSSATLESIEAWTAEEEHAQRERAHNITAMDIYDIKMKRCEYYLFILAFLTFGFSPISLQNTSRIDRKRNNDLWP